MILLPLRFEPHKQATLKKTCRWIIWEAQPQVSSCLDVTKNYCAMLVVLVPTAFSPTSFLAFTHLAESDEEVVG